ncbi:MAG: DUF433 domain-containing protein [Bacteroidota bacterium]
MEQAPGVVEGRPRIAGRRIALQHIAAWRERLGLSADEIASEYDLALADAYAALAYYYSQREDVDAAIREGEAFAEAMRAQMPSKARDLPDGRDD